MTRWEAREEMLREVVADRDTAKELLRDLRDHFPAAFRAIVRKLDALWAKRVADVQSAVPVAMEKLDEESLEEEEGV
jgi:hypothetical protein